KYRLRSVAAVSSDCEKSFAGGNEYGEAGLALEPEFWFSATLTITAKGMHKWRITPLFHYRTLMCRLAKRMC
ncbi:MAG: hypothetical protein ACLTBZ_11180, partial [Faecalispora jeddahensis]|uniref:hypothetical protein n=1 Tax=Faecalispora jeddahensis TaxID=1414721 RepID=UPI0039959FDA